MREFGEMIGFIVSRLTDVLEDRNTMGFDLAAAAAPKTVTLPNQNPSDLIGRMPLKKREGTMQQEQAETISRALDGFRIEIPSWGFANTGTRFGKFIQPAAATAVEEKLSDAGQVHSLTGVCPTVALHVLWDFPEGIASVSAVEKVAGQYGVRPGAVNPNVFQDQIYKYGSFENLTRRCVHAHSSM